MRLIAAGINDCEISRRTGVPRSTVREWRRPSYVRRTQAAICPCCWRGMKPIRFTADDYAELLALYLGDGCISNHPRTTRLRIALDSKYPMIIRDTRALLERCFPDNNVDAVLTHGGTCTHLSVYCSHLPCLFPQHGPGPKHLRRIVLEPWQRELLKESPWPFLRGCIRSDGCAFVNRTRSYEYLSYDFTNMSEDITRLFTAACDLVGIRDYRVNRDRHGCWDVRINHRASVAQMVENVGLKT